MQSLATRYPWRFDVPLLLSISLVLLAQGLTMPAMEIRALIFWVNEYSILSNIQNLFDHHKLPAAFTLLGCSVVYPAAKILVLLFLWLSPFPAKWRHRSVRLMRLLGRWSLVDVFAVTAVVAGSRTVGFLLDARPLPGIYVYAASIFVLMMATVLLDRLASHGRG